MKILKFYADWCRPCKVYAPILESFAEKNNIELQSIDIETNQELAKEYSIRSLPTTVFIKGDIVKSVVWVMQEDALEKIINEL